MWNILDICSREFKPTLGWLANLNPSLKNFPKTGFLTYHLQNLPKHRFKAFCTTFYDILMVTSNLCVAWKADDKRWWWWCVDRDKMHLRCKEGDFYAWLSSLEGRSKINCQASVGELDLRSFKWGKIPTFQLVMFQATLSASSKCFIFLSTASKQLKGKCSAVGNVIGPPEIGI